MEELIKRLERVIATGAPDKDGMHPISAEAVLEVVKGLSELGTNLSEVGTDLISRQAAIDALENDKAALDKIIKGMSAEDMLLKYYVAQHNQVSYDIDAIVQLPPIQPEIVRCKDCKYYRHGLCMKASMCVNKSENGFCDWAEKREVTT